MNKILSTYELSSIVIDMASRIEEIEQKASLIESMSSKISKLEKDIKAKDDEISDLEEANKLIQNRGNL